MNAVYPLTSALCLELARFLGDRQFREIAIGNLQWIAGLNAGVTAESITPASHMWTTDVPPGQAIPTSMINGIGRRTAGTWLNVRGAICNGFATGDQFRYELSPIKANDGPHASTDEDWITHAGGGSGRWRGWGDRLLGRS